VIDSIAKFNIPTRDEEYNVSTRDDKSKLGWKHVSTLTRVMPVNNFFF
jgi:hypothetical protein